MKYKIKNITNGYITLEPPNILRRDTEIIREYPNGKLPDRIRHFRDVGMIDVSPLKEESYNFPVEASKPIPPEAGRLEQQPRKKVAIDHEKTIKNEYKIKVTESKTTIVNPSLKMKPGSDLIEVADLSILNLIEV